MTEVQEQAVLIGDRQLAEHTGRSRTTVRDWHQRPFNSIPFTINEKGHRVFKIAEVDAWRGSGDGDSGISPMRQEMNRLKEENRKLELQVSELKTTTTVTLDRAGQFLEAREAFRSLVSECRKQMPDATDANLLKVDEFVVDFFNKVQSHLRLDTDTAQNNQVISK